ncbi:cytochrome c peroxidase [Litoreibacter meonggei]|uniref:Cytochrome c peroxidase n=1 Tax=Litoreibacter meonggei TaxID=1049199 RepID=A0A497WPI5_9RHOB|nr:cytochrome c peroxidase [Litoreibacter meonggei]RLJ51869.1 cytochrome c peroxidase [Litoreibacter meonggei]
MAPAIVLADPFPTALTAADFNPGDQDQAALGQLLFYDKILSGNKNISCGTCHHPKFGTSDGWSLGIGEGGAGLGTDRNAGVGDSRIERRVPRNAPALWNLGARDVHTLMHDGRISRAETYGNGFNTPAEEWLPDGIDTVLAAQALFPLTSETEMAGGSGENEVAGAVNDRIDNGWLIIAKRVRIIPEYGQLFVDAFDHVTTPEDVTIVDIANALAAFQAVEFQSIDSPFDQYLAGDISALNGAQKRGFDLFYGKAGCASCHSGPLLSDQSFHAIGLPPFGPGRTRKFDLIARDVGRLGESDRLEDAYKFRTPMLRNVALSAPYGHNGAHKTLADMIRQHVDPQAMFKTWTPTKAKLPEVRWLQHADFLIWQDSAEIARQQRVLTPRSPSLSDAEIGYLVAFLTALTGSSLGSPVFGIPVRVPSGLAVD